MAQLVGLKEANEMLKESCKKRKKQCKNIKTRIDNIENLLTTFSGMEESMKQLKKENKQLRKHVDRLKRRANNTVVLQNVCFVNFLVCALVGAGFNLSAENWSAEDEEGFDGAVANVGTRVQSYLSKSGKRVTDAKRRRLTSDRLPDDATDGANLNNAASDAKQ
uniref:BZIP domain-containing protein n=1 Tax=Panagrolaimus superbus TaxID=310955 RepID=A0A914XXA2_9BILA